MARRHQSQFLRCEQARGPHRRQPFLKRQLPGHGHLGGIVGLPANKKRAPETTPEAPTNRSDVYDPVHGRRSWSPLKRPDPPAPGGLGPAPATPKRALVPRGPGKAPGGGDRSGRPLPAAGGFRHVPGPPAPRRGSCAGLVHQRGPSRSTRRISFDPAAGL